MTVASVTEFVPSITIPTGAKGMRPQARAWADVAADEFAVCFPEVEYDDRYAAAYGEFYLRYLFMAGS